MKLLELAADEIAVGYYDPANDRLNRRNPGDVRKPKLLLRSVNKLKRMRALRSLEGHKRQDLLVTMYAQPADEAGGMGGMPGGF